MEDTTCDLCGSKQAALYLRRRDRFSDEDFTYVKCDTCALIYLNPRPRPDEILRYYPDGYEAHVLRPADQVALGSRRRRAMRILRQMVEGHVKEGVLLDVGCATGEFLAEMREHGWRHVQGIELSPAVADYARCTYGLNVFAGSIADFRTEAQFDVVTLWDVLEHLYSPLESLRALRRLLADDGNLVFSVPNLRSYDRRLFGKYWIGWDAPRHLHLFEDGVMADLLWRAGLEIVDRKCILGGPGAFLLSLSYWAERTRGRRFLNSGISRMVGRLLPVLLWPYKSVAYSQLRGPVITYVAQPGKGRTCAAT